MKHLRLAILLLITLISIFFAFSGVDMHTTMDALQEANLWYFVGVFAGYLLTHSIRTVRLWLLIGWQSNFASMFTINTIGFLAINVLPLRMGEFVRPYLMIEKENIPLSKAMVAIVLERWLDMCMLLLMLLGLGLFVELPEQAITVGGINIVEAGQRLLTIMITIGFIGLGAMTMLGTEWIASIGTRYPLLERPITLILSTKEHIVLFFRSPLLAVQAFLLSASVWAGTMLAIWFALLAFPSLPHSLGVVWSVWTITLVGMVVAPTPGFIGVYELFCAIALALWGVEKSIGTSFALALHFSQLGFTLVIGSIFLAKEGLHLGQLWRASQQQHKTNSSD